MESDSDVQRSVQDELKWEPGVSDAAKIGVAVKKGVVTLTGFVSSYAEKWAAERASKRVSGVNALAVELQVQLPDHVKKTDADIAKAAENAWMLETAARMAYLTLNINPDASAVARALHDKHFLRKHGSSSYYGQGYIR